MDDIIKNNHHKNAEKTPDTGVSRRTAFKTAGILVGAAAGAAGVFATGALVAPASAAHEKTSDKPIRIGFQVHRTGIGAAYGKWYERTTNAAVKQINSHGGIAGRPIKLIVEDDGTDPKRGAEVVEKLVLKHKVDFILGALFSHVVNASSPRAGELKTPYFAVSEGYHVASGLLNRYAFQPGITDVRSQVQGISSWVLNNLGKNVAMIYPDYAFGYNHRDFFSAAVTANGGRVTVSLAIPPTESSYTKYFAKIPSNTDLIYHVMVGPGVFTFVQEMGEHFGSNHPELFGFIDSLEAVDMAAPGLGFLEGSHFWEGMPRYAGDQDGIGANYYRAKVGVDANGASLDDPKDISTYSHMFSCWETLYAIKQAVEDSGYQDRTAKDKEAFIETLENTRWYNEGIAHPQGHKMFNGKLHQCFSSQYISKVINQKLKPVHTTSIEDGFYETDVDYTKMSL